MYVVYARREITPPVQALIAGWEEKFMQHTSTENIRHIFLLLRIISAWYFYIHVMRYNPVFMKTINTMLDLKG